MLLCQWDIFLFCLPEPGDIHTTDYIINRMSPDEVFTLTIQIRDVSHYPPRVITSDITVSARSICTNTTKTMRSLFEQCNKTVIKNVTMSSLFPVDISKDKYEIKNEPRKTYKTYPHYITGLVRTSGVQVISQDQVGSYIGIILDYKSKRSKSEALFYWPIFNFR